MNVWCQLKASPSPLAILKSYNILIPCSANDFARVIPKENKGKLRKRGKKIPPRVPGHLFLLIHATRQRRKIGSSADREE
jgi:hypothetical protein